MAVNRWLFEARPALNMSCQDKGMPSRAARGDRKLKMNGVGERHGAKLDGKEAVERLAASAISNREDPRFLDTAYPSFFICYNMVCRF